MVWLGPNLNFSLSLSLSPSPSLSPRRLTLRAPRYQRWMMQRMRGGWPEVVLHHAAVASPWMMKRVRWRRQRMLQQQQRGR